MTATDRETGRPTYKYDPTNYRINDTHSVDVTDLSYMHWINNQMENYFPQEVTELM